MDNEEIMYRRLRPLRTGGLSLNEARDILLESMGPMLDQLEPMEGRCRQPRH